MITRKLLALTAAAGLSFTLAACGDDSSGTTATNSNNASATTADNNVETESQTTVADSDATSDRDPVFNAIDLVMAQYPDGIIRDIDRDDDTVAYGVDVVVGQDIIELDVNSATGDVREDGRDNDSEDISEANEATVTAADAIAQALEAHPDGVLDEASLNRDFGQLEWEIELDDAERNDLTELSIPAI